MAVKWRVQAQEFQMMPAHQRSARAEVLKGAQAVEAFKRARMSLSISALRQLLQWTSSHRRVVHLQDLQVITEIEHELAVGELLIITNHKPQPISHGVVTQQQNPPRQPAEQPAVREEEEGLALSFRIWPDEPPAFTVEAELDPPPSLEAENEVEPPPKLEPALELEPPPGIEPEVEEDHIPGITI